MTQLVPLSVPNSQMASTAQATIASVQVMMTGAIRKTRPCSHWQESIDFFEDQL